MSPATRTRFSFEAAMQKLGGGVLSAENMRESSSATKGETIEDTVRIVSGYADAIAIRHYEQGTAEAAARISPVPIINAGDGVGEHPTQALTDVYTIKKELGRIGGLKVALVGDLLNGRTIHSLLPAAVPVSRRAHRSRLAVATAPAAAPPRVPAGGRGSPSTRVRSSPVRSTTQMWSTSPRVQRERFASEEEYPRGQRQLHH